VMEEKFKGRGQWDRGRVKEGRQSITYNWRRRGGWGLAWIRWLQQVITHAKGIFESSLVENPAREQCSEWRSTSWGFERAREHPTGNRPHWQGAAQPQHPLSCAQVRAAAASRARAGGVIHRFRWIYRLPLANAASGCQIGLCTIW